MGSKLIVNADDFGLEEDVNLAVIKAHEEGIVTSTSLLAIGNAFEHAVALAQEHARLGVGAHLALTRGPSLAGAPLTGGDATSAPGKAVFLPRNPLMLAARVALGVVRLDEVENELRAQMTKIAAAGISITHIDSHQHIHLVPAIFRVVRKLAEEFQVSWVRIPLSLPAAYRKPAGSLRGQAKQALLGKLAVWNLRKLPVGHAIRWADFHSGIEHSGHFLESQIAEAIRNLPDAVVEISCHPGLHNARLSRNHPWGYLWEQECAALCSQNVLAAVKESNVHLVNYQNLPVAHQAI